MGRRPYLKERPTKAVNIRFPPEFYDLWMKCRKAKLTTLSFASFARECFGVVANRMVKEKATLLNGDLIKIKVKERERGGNGSAKKK